MDPGIRIRLNHQKIHADDCAECETTVGEWIGSSGRSTSEETWTLARRPLMEIADRCPARRTLSLFETAVDGGLNG